MIVPWAIIWSDEDARRWVANCPYIQRPAIFHPLLRGHGHPLYTKLHPNRQRQAVAECLCHICGGALRGRQKLSLGVMEDNRVVDPFVCLPCAKLSLEQCPELRWQIDNGKLRIRDVTAWAMHPADLDDMPGVVDGFDIELIAWTDLTIEALG